MMRTRRNTILDTAAEVITSVRDLHPCGDSQTSALAIALGRLCAETGVDLDTAKALASIAYDEAVGARLVA